MYSKYPKLCDLFLDKYWFIFVDEYQDTSPLVVEILLKFLQMRTKKNIIGFFGDSMQSIYEHGVGDIDDYIADNIVYKVEKKQNRRNPPSVINLSNNYHELIKKIFFPICSIHNKKRVKECIDKLKQQVTRTIESVIEYVDAEHLCVIDDKLKNFIENNEYLYWRVKNVAFSEFQKLYEYLEGYMPFSTQRKIKGLEFRDVLIILHNGGWNNYNFEYLFDPNIQERLTGSQKIAIIIF